MTTAILEILALLSVSCLIGIFFTYRFWKSKYDGLAGQLANSQSSYSRLKDQFAQLEIEFSTVNVEFKDLKDQLNHQKTAIKDLSVQMKQSNDLLDSEKSINLKMADQIKAYEQQIETLKNAQPKKAKAKSLPADKKEIKQLKEHIGVMDEEIQELEREISELMKEMSKGKISYYKQIDGKRYKAITINMVDQSVAGRGDGRISKEDAEKIFATISDGSQYTNVEKHTMRYLRNHYKWTDGADHLFRTKVRSWAAKGHHLE